MSQKLWNKAKKKAKALNEVDLQTEYISIITELGKEEVERKNEIIYTYLENKWDNIWSLIDSEYRKINGTEGARPRQEELETLAGQHDMEFTRSGSSVWLVEHVINCDWETDSTCQTSH
jgi:hypothetical protein